MIPLSLYIHLPWCIRKCPYCDFNSHRAPVNLPESAYAKALLDDLSNDLAYVQHRKLHSIFFGGGTPSLFSPSVIGDLLTQIEQSIPFENNIEITLEANPGAIDQKRFADFKAAGINRLSIGIQSFDSEKLKTLGRIHNSEEAKKAIAVAIQAGFDNFNLDLMHGLPNQTLKEALLDLQTAIDYQPTHLSWYQLTLEPNTVFAKHPPHLPGLDLCADIESEGFALLATHGFSRYEISAFTRHQRYCQHNLNYWKFGDYLGIGAGAHSKLTTLSSMQITRLEKIKHPQTYLNSNNKIAEEKKVKSNVLPFEFMLNALRLCDGVSEALFSQRTGLDLSIVQTTLDDLRRKKLITKDSLRPTAKGLQFYNHLVMQFLVSE